MRQDELKAEAGKIGTSTADWVMISGDSTIALWWLQPSLSIRVGGERSNIKHQTSDIKFSDASAVKSSIY